MKKVILSALLGMAAMGAGATEYVVHSVSALGEGQVQIPCNFYEWEGTFSSAEVDGASVWTINNDGWFGGGWETDASFDISVLNKTNVKLMFEVKTEFTGNFTLQFNNTSKGVSIQPASIAGVVRDGEWHEMEIDVRNTFPGVLESLENGNKLYCFAPVGGNGGAGKTIAFRNIRFVEGEEVVPPTYEFGAVWYGSVEGSTSISGKDYAITCDYSVTANEDGTVTVDAAIDGVEGIPNFTPKMHIAGEWPAFTKKDDGTYTVTSPKTFTLGQKVHEFFFWLEYAGGVVRIDVNPAYLFGSANDKPVKQIAPKLTASVENVTAFGAELAYEVTLPEELAGADVKVFYNETEAAGSPIVLEDLTPNTAYAYELKAVATLDGETYESKVVKLEFRTLRDGAVAMVWHTIADGMINNAYLPGEDPATMRRQIPISIETTVTYNPDGTITVDAVPHGGNVVGLVPQITISSSDYKFEYKALTVTDGKWSITTDTEYPLDHNIGWLYFFMAYDGGSSTVNVNGYTTGLENEPVAYGEPASIRFSLSRSQFAIGDKAVVSAIAVDEAGHYLLEQNPEITVDGAAFTIEGSTLTAVAQGTATVKAAVGELTESVEVECFLNEKAKRLENVAVTSDHDNWAAAFDGNEGTQVEWSCAETEEHYISVDLGKVKHIQAVMLVWEGASATEYTVTLAKANGEDEALRVEAKDGHVFTVTDGEGGAGVTARKNLYVEGYVPVAARYVTLNTTKAFNTGWGIKLKEMHIMGNDAEVSGVEDVAVADQDAPVNVYNMQGVCLMRGVTVAEACSQLPAGLYIMGGRKIAVK